MDKPLDRCVLSCIAVSLAILVFWCAVGTAAQAPPNDYASALKRAAELSARGDLEGVVRTLSPWIEAHPDRSEAQHTLGLAYYQRGDYGGAIHHLSAALKLETENSAEWKQAVETLGMAYYFGNRVQE